MHMLPKSHDSGFYKHHAGSKFHIDYTMVDTPQPEDVSSVFILCYKTTCKLSVRLAPGLTLCIENPGFQRECALLCRLHILQGSLIHSAINT